MGDQTQALTVAEYNTGIIERVLIVGDLSKLQPDERVNYYRAVCKSVGLNPLTQPFAYINLQGKLTLYAKKDCTEQLRKIHNVSVTKLERDTVNGVYIVTAYARLDDGRQDSSTGAVNTEGLKGDALANAIMKAETKAKRRVTLSICGLGFLDETEIDTTPGRVVNVRETGEIEPEPPLKDDYSVKPNGKTITDRSAQDNGSKPATLKYQPFVSWANQWAQGNGKRYARENDSKLVNMRHLLNRIGALGFAQVTEQNADDIKAALESYVKGNVDAGTGAM